MRGSGGAADDRVRNLFARLPGSSVLEVFRDGDDDPHLGRVDSAWFLMKRCTGALHWAQDRARIK